MANTIIELISLIWKTPVAFLRGWWVPLKKGTVGLVEFLRGLGIGWLLLIAGLSGMMLAGIPWFSYQIQFESPETFSIRSRFWAFFWLTGFFALLSVLVQYPFRKSIVLILSIGALSLYGLGLLWPSFIHVEFHPDTQYNVLWSHWIYPAAPVIALLAGAFLPDEAGWNVRGNVEELKRIPD